MQFLLHQQAQFAADLAASQARHAADLAASEARFDARFDRLLAKIEQVADGLIGLTAIVGRVVESVSQIAEAQKRHLREDHGHRPL